MVKLKRKTLILLLIGTITMSFCALTSGFLNISEDLRDFMTGAGFVFILTALLSYSRERSSLSNNIPQA